MKKLLAILISVMLLAGSCAFAEGATGEIIFGLTAPVTGSQAAGGEQAQKGMELAIEEVNNAGGITLSDGTTYTITPVSYTHLLLRRQRRHHAADGGFDQPEVLLRPGLFLIIEPFVDPAAHQNVGLKLVFAEDDVQRPAALAHALFHALGDHRRDLGQLSLIHI